MTVINLCLMVCGVRHTRCSSTFPQVEFGYDKNVSSGAVHMAERYFLYPTTDGISLVVWDVERQQVVGHLVGHDKYIVLVAARGSLAVSYQESGPIRARVWNLETMQCTATLPDGPNGTYAKAECSMEGKVLLGRERGVIKVWDVAAGAPVALADLEGHAGWVNDIQVGAAGNMVLSGSNDNTAQLWDLRTNDGRCVRTMEGHSDSVRSVDMDGHYRTAVSGSDDKTVKLWDLGSGRCVETYDGHDHTNVVPGVELYGVIDVVMHESGSSFLSSGHYYGSMGNNNTVSAWATGSSEAILRADMASSCVPLSVYNRLFSTRDFSTVAFCSIGYKQLKLSVWNQGMHI